MDSIKLGSLYFEAESSWPVGSVCTSKGVFSIGDTAPQNEIAWVLVGGKLIATKIICANISWRNLDKNGFIKGRSLTIDGMAFRCRLPLVADDDQFGNPIGTNEWAELQALVGDADEDIHWKSNLFWAQKPGIKGVEGRVQIGISTPNYRCYSGLRATHMTTGFRPVLEPVGQFKGSYKKLLNHRVGIIVSDAVIHGTLIESTDYDLTIKLDSRVGARQNRPSKWSLLDINGTVDIIRSKVEFIFALDREENNR